MLFQLFTLEGVDNNELVSTLQKEIDLQIVLTDWQSKTTLKMNFD